MRRDANTNPNQAPPFPAPPIQVHPGIPLRHVCPRCNGTGRTVPAELPIGGRRLGCALCGDSGRVDDEAMSRVRAGRAIRSERRESRLTPRQFAAQCGVSVVDLLLMEQGLRPATPRVMDRACPVMRSPDGMERRLNSPHALASLAGRRYASDLEGRVDEDARRAAERLLALAWRRGFQTGARRAARKGEDRRG